MRPLHSLTMALITVAAVQTGYAEETSMNNLEDYVSANMAFTNDYVFRGISQSDETFAVQGGIDLEHDSGLYLGAWASSVDFNDDSATVQGATAEVDVYGGYASTFKDWFNYDLGVIYYIYPGADESLNYDFVEFAAGVDKDVHDVNVGFSINYSPEYFGNSGDGYYFQLSAEKEVLANLTASAHVGRQIIEDSGAFGSPSYNDWAIGVTYNWAGFDWSATYMDTDLSRAELADGGEGRGVFSISKAF